MPCDSSPVDPLAHFYDFGDDFGDTAPPGTDEWWNIEGPVPAHFPFFCKNKTSIYVSCLDLK